MLEMLKVSNTVPLQVLNIVQGTVFGALRLGKEFMSLVLFSSQIAPTTAKKRKSWDPKNMVAAVNAVRRNYMGLNKADKSFNVPRSTLKDYVKKGEHDVEKRVLGNLGRKPVLPPELGRELAKFCLNVEKNSFGLTTKAIRRMAFSLAIRNNSRHPFSEILECAGKKWLANF
jgi:hypothetical protein